jgi:hypothetical protein
MTIDQILADYEDLERDDVLAAPEYAARLNPGEAYSAERRCMRFLIDAQLPRRLAGRLCTEGHEALHTLDLPAGNRTRDETVASVANGERP